MLLKSLCKVGLASRKTVLGNKESYSQDLKYTSALRLLALCGCEHVVFAEGALRAPRQFKNV